MTFLRKGDMVKILVGKDRAKTGKVIFVKADSGKATVEGRNLAVRHERPKRAGQKGQKIQFPRPVAISNLMLICPHCKKPSRVGQHLDAEGRKSRICKNCGKQI